MLDAEAFLAAALEEAKASSVTCASCGSAELEEKIVTQNVPFGGTGEHFEVNVPVITCRECAMSFTDHRAEKMRKDALYAHLGLLNPEEIKSIRANLHMSRKDFDAAFGLPPASVERWENGKLIQNRSMDTLLRALANKATAHRLDRRSSRDTNPSSDNVIRGKFPTLEAKPNGLEQARERSAGFLLRAAIQ